MKVRLVDLQDLDQMVDLCRARAEVEASQHVFDPEMVRSTVLQSVATAHPTIFVVEDQSEIVGFLLASLHGYGFTRGLNVLVESIYVTPGKRGTRAAAMLIAEVIDWAAARRAKEIYGGNSNGLKSDQIRKFFERHGFEMVGYSMRRAL